MIPSLIATQWRRLEDSHILKPRNVSKVIGCELSRQLNEPAGGVGCVASILQTPNLESLNPKSSFKSRRFVVVERGFARVVVMRQLVSVMFPYF